MKMLKYFAFVVAIVGVSFMQSAPKARAQVGIGINIGPAPVCPYGYFDYPPYDCAPYGYYGPDWFVDGLFIGAGPWFHRDHGFYGHVDNRYDPHHGYNGPMPERNAQAFTHFQGNEARDGRGNVGNAGHEPTNEHSAGFSHAGGGGHPGGGHPR